MVILRRLTQEDLPRLRQFWIEHWGGEEIISLGNVYHLIGYNNIPLRDEIELELKLT
jgi:hypothetical protein